MTLPAQRASPSLAASRRASASQRSQTVIKSTAAINPFRRIAIPPAPSYAAQPPRHAGGHASSRPPAHRLSPR